MTKEINQEKDEPVAYFDPQKNGFYWARPTKVEAPITVDVEPLPLYTTPQLKQEQGEPVGIANVGDDNKWYFLPLVPRSELPGGTKLYAKPQPKRKPLTDEQIVAIVREASNGSAIRREGSTSMRIARAIEAAHGIKE